MDIYDGIMNKPNIEEVLYHAGFHKYIDKYLGKNGKWIYKYAGKANGLVNKAKTILPGLQSQAAGAVTTAKKKTSSIASTGSNTASSLKKQAKSRISKMLPILSKKYNAAKKSASGTANKLKKKTKGKYYRAKSKMAELNAQSARSHTRVKDTDTTQKTRTIRTGYYNKWEAHGIKSGTNGKANSHSGQIGSRVNQGIAAGRERVAKKKKKK